MRPISQFAKEAPALAEAGVGANAGAGVGAMTGTGVAGATTSSHGTDAPIAKTGTGEGVSKKDPPPPPPPLSHESARRGLFGTKFDGDVGSSIEFKANWSSMSRADNL